MSRRVLISIGCNFYSDVASFEPLRAAESDAASIFNLLIQSECGSYDKGHSTLLLSPNWEQVQAALRKCLFDRTRIDTLTIFFAGHGALKNDSFFLCLSDSDGNALSATALSLSSLLQMIGEAAPTQANVVLDACQSGGLASDLNAILKHDVLGKGGSPGVTLLAAAASDENAFEVEDGGILTRALISCVSGAQFVQSHSPALDLVDIGRVVSTKVSQQGAQTPLVWGLSLVGAARFCKNPHHTGPSSANLFLLDSDNAGAHADAVRSAIPKLYRIYEDAAEKFEVRKLLDVVQPIAAMNSDSPSEAITLISRIQNAFREQLRESPDQFAAIEARATCLLPLSTVCNASADVRAFVRSSALEIVDDAVRLLAEAVREADGDQYSLLSKYGGVADLYFLPIRLTKMFGWAGLCVLLKREFKEDATEAIQLLNRFIVLVERDYSTAFRAVSDAQAPYVHLGLIACREASLLDVGETALSLLASSVLQCGGNVGRNNLQGEEILDYLVTRATGEWDEKRPLIAQPSELVMTLLANAPSFSLADELDYDLRALDHVFINAFLPKDWESFAAAPLVDGENHTIEIGRDYFRVAEIVSCLESLCPESLPAPELATLALLGSALLPDRTAWFPWFRLQAAAAQAAA